MTKLLYLLLGMCLGLVAVAVLALTLDDAVRELDLCRAVLAHQPAGYRLACPRGLAAACDQCRVVPIP